ncbi:hypothetical protein GIB67_019704 [Kingdonia uniflora]|uniref:Uncharacterized protein n=1 Tax=Kingdonia uniflora TaxID=39325 RepID=A0A7J7MKC0_9MAGN|nr:hypothetical protein GIB67_019704 [Kingdonia uniflora]
MFSPWGEWIPYCEIDLEDEYFKVDDPMSLADLEETPQIQPSMSPSIISFVNPINCFEETMIETEYFSLSSNDFSDDDDDEIKYEYMESPSHYTIICEEFVDDDICTKVKKFEIVEPVVDVINLSFLSQSPYELPQSFFKPRPPDTNYNIRNQWVDDPSLQDIALLLGADSVLATHSQTAPIPMPTSPFHEPNGATMTINDFEDLYEDNSCCISINECLNYFEDSNDPKIREMLFQVLIKFIFPVQLVPGTEVAVAPKRRRTSVNSHRDSHTQGSRKEKSLIKALLRVQGPTKDWVHRCEVKGIDLSVVLTSVAFIHPEAANHSKLSNHQLIIIFRKSPPKEDMKIAETITRKSSSAAKDGAVSSFTDKEPTRHTIVHLLLSESVAKGHVMLPHSLRLYLRATLHSCKFVLDYVKEYDVPPQKDIPPLKLSPCRFKLYRKDEALKENGSNFPEKNGNRRMKNMAFRTNMLDIDGLMDWSTHEELVVSLSSQKSNFEVEEVTSQFCDKKVLQSFLHV